jgi:predicted Zn finger-like uncharacterized protein
MDITCDKCNSKFRVPDEKIPAGLESISCPKCKNKIPINSAPKTVEAAPEIKEQPAAEPAQKSEFSFDEAPSPGIDSYDATDKPFDFVEEEGKTALVCEADPEFKKKILETLHLMEYSITEAKNGRDVLKKMRYHNYDVIVLNEKFDNPNPDANPVIMNLERMQMSIRRNIFVALLSERFRTMDNMTAFQKSVNMIINTRNMDDFGKIFSRGVSDNEYFYRIFKESMKKAGKA